MVRHAVSGGGLPNHAADRGIMHAAHLEKDVMLDLIDCISVIALSYLPKRESQPEFQPQPASEACFSGRLIR
jgi:hypothetical protein